MSGFPTRQQQTLSVLSNDFTQTTGKIGSAVSLRQKSQKDLDKQAAHPLPRAHRGISLAVSSHRHQRVQCKGTHDNMNMISQSQEGDRQKLVPRVSTKVLFSSHRGVTVKGCGTACAIIVVTNMDVSIPNETSKAQIHEQYLGN